MSTERTETTITRAQYEARVRAAAYLCWQQRVSANAASDWTQGELDVAAQMAREGIAVDRARQVTTIGQFLGELQAARGPSGASDRMARSDTTASPKAHGSM